MQKWPVVERKTYQTEPIDFNVLFVFELNRTMNAKSLKTISDYRNVILIMLQYTR